MLSEIYPIKFLFTNVDRYNKTYDTELSRKIEGLDGVDYTVVKNYHGLSLGAMKATMGDYDVFVGGSWDTLTDLIETMIYFVVVKIRRKPFILWREDWDWNVKSLKRSLVKKFAGFIGRNVDAVLVPGTKHREFFTKLGVKTENVFIMPNVSNIEAKEQDKLNRAQIQEELGLENKKVALYVGRLIDLKGVDYLIKGFKGVTEKLDDAVLLIVGEGPEKPALESLTSKLGMDGEVIFTGNIDNSKLGAYYMVSDLFVLPSITTYFADACPLVVNEAMYFSKPVITSDGVGTTFMIKEGENGYVVPERNSEALKIAILTVLSDPELIEKMGLASKKLIETKFRYDNMIQGFNQAIEHVQNK
ncbi:MAG: glycosyltransferase family 4 protein [Methanobacterium sp. ERen5]|nr:MAG: glycosyltransferase family 4 protein [Methanobacterium sp. ERen5]